MDSPCGDPAGDELLLALLLPRVGQHLGREGGREHDHAVGVADHDVAGLDRHPGAGHRDLGFPRDVAPAQHGRVDGRVVGRDLQPGQCRAVPDRAVGDDPGRAADLGAQREDVADGARGGVAAGLDDQHLAGPDLLDRLLLRVQPPPYRSIRSSRSGR